MPSVMCVGVSHPSWPPQAEHDAGDGACRVHHAALQHPQVQGAQSQHSSCAFSIHECRERHTKWFLDVPKDCDQGLSACLHSQPGFHPVFPEHRAFWAAAKAARDPPVRPALMLPLRMVQVGGLDVWWAHAVLAVIGRTSWGLVWASLLLMVAPVTTCSLTLALSPVKASLRLHSAVKVRCSGVCRLVQGICCLVACLCLWV